jgi:hypothetical protein
MLEQKGAKSAKDLSRQVILAIQLATIDGPRFRLQTGRPQDAAFLSPRLEIGLNAREVREFERLWQ